jgi:hypothetical protein
LRFHHLAEAVKIYVTVLISIAIGARVFRRK